MNIDIDIDTETQPQEGHVGLKIKLEGTSEENDDIMAFIAHMKATAPEDVTVSSKIG